MHIMKDGTVGNVRILGSSGDAEWDSMAAQSMKQWAVFDSPSKRNPGRSLDASARDRANPAAHHAHPRRTRLILQAGSRFVVCAARRRTKFETLAKHEGVESSAVNGKYLGSVDISSYPRPVREELRKLREDEVSRPVRIGEKYIIYKRFKQDPSTAVPQ